MAPTIFMLLIAFLILLSFYFKNDDFFKLGIPFILIGITFSTASVTQSESLFITIFFVLQIFLSLSLPEKIAEKAKLIKIAPLAILTLGILFIAGYMDGKNSISENSLIQSIENTLETGSDVYILLLILILILFSKVATKRDSKWS